MNRLTWDEYFIEVARSTSGRSTCPRRSVGAIVVDHNHRICGGGYNGSAPGEPHCSDSGCIDVGGSCQRTTHAEANALRYARRRARGGTLYTTDFPCKNCAKLICNSGIIEVVYDKPYKSESDTKVLALFHENGIVCRKLVAQEKRQLIAIDPD